MGKKKAPADSAVVRLGRPGNNVKMGVMDVPAENFPFCTIEPSLSRPKSVKPAVLGVTDIAGLVKGASEGAGLGNAFLSNIQATDGIFHMVREFKDKNVTHVETSIDPIRDIEIINDELPKGKLVNRGTLVKALELLQSGTALRFGKWTPKDCIVLNELQLLTAKPQIYLVNISNWLPKIAEYLAANGGEQMIPFTTKVQKETKVNSALPSIIKKGYHCLNLIHFFTAGPDEVRGWSIQNGWCAPQAAGTIHGDFEKEKGLCRQQGKGYVIKDGDVCHFKHNAPKPKKKQKE
eukprot:GSMAST32.ASY1.ANO1.1524.1 assembled CDS